MAEERGGRSHRLYLWWLAVVAPAVRLWFGISRDVGWHQARRRRQLVLLLGALALVHIYHNPPQDAHDSLPAAKSGTP